MVCVEDRDAQYGCSIAEYITPKENFENIVFFHIGGQICKANPEILTIHHTKDTKNCS